MTYFFETDCAHFTSFKWVNSKVRSFVIGIVIAVNRSV